MKCIFIADCVLSPGKALVSDLDGLKRTLDQLDTTLMSRIQESLPRDLSQVETMVIKHKVGQILIHLVSLLRLLLLPVDSSMISLAA